MSAAFGIQASRWPCMFSYVGGNERTKDGLGIVVSGSEKVFHQTNPWDSLGLEWQTASPIPPHNFDRIPVIMADPYHYSEEGAPPLADFGAGPRENVSAASASTATSVSEE